MHAVTKHEKITVNIINVSEICSCAFAGGGSLGIVTETVKKKDYITFSTNYFTSCKNEIYLIYVRVGQKTGL